MGLFTKRYLSIDMGNHSYKVIEAEIKPRLRIIKYGTYSILKDGASFAKDLRNSGYHAKDTLLSFHDPSMIIRELSLPNMNQQDLYENIMLEMSELVLLQEYSIGYKIIPNPDNASLCFAMVAACPQRITRQYINMTTDSGLSLKVLDAQANTGFRIIQFLIHHCKQLSNLSGYLLVDLGFHNTSISIIGFGRVLCHKIVSIGSRELTVDAVQIEEKLSQLEVECNRVIEYFQMSNTNIPLNKGFLYGGGVYMPHLSLYLNNHIRLNMKEINSYREYFPEIPLDMDLNLYTNSLGALFREEDIV